MALMVKAGRGPLLPVLREILERYSPGLDLSRGVLLKPNIVFPVKGDCGEVTRPRLVGALIEALREIRPGVEIVLGEGTAAGTVPDENFRVSGFSELARRHRVPLVDFDRAERVRVPWAYGHLDLPRLALEKTYINLPILKMSSAATFSAALKNQKGLLTPAMKKRFHRLGLHRPIAELARAIAPSLTILDGGAFFRGETLVAGDDLCEVDRWVADRLGVSAPDYLAMAERLLPRPSPSPVEGDEAQPRQKPGGWNEPYKSLLNIRLWSNPRACSACRLRFFELRKVSPLRPLESLALYGRLARRAITGADLLFGSDPSFEEGRPRIVCVGDCTRSLAEERGFPFVPGCPPSARDILGNL